MRGSIKQRGKDTWLLQVYTGERDASGKPCRYYETVKSPRIGDARKRLSELLVEREKGSLVTGPQITIAEHFNNWLQGYAKTNCSQSTYEGYQSIIKNYLAPAFGGLKMKQLKPQIISNYYGKAIEKLSNRTVYHQHRVLSQSLKYAVRQGYLGRNPCDMVDPPRPVKMNMRTLTPSEVKILLESAASNRYYPLIYTAVSSGLRRAELLSLRWRDLDLESDVCSISVNQVLYKSHGITQFKEPKTAHSRRRVDMTPKLTVYLKNYQAMREAEYLVRKKKLTLDSLVFNDINDKPFDPSVLSHEFTKIVKRAGLGHVRFHDLRHTFASIMLLRGVSPKVISEALGHASVGFTMDTYSHIIKGMGKDAMKLLDGALPEGISQESNDKLTTKSDIM